MNKRILLKHFGVGEPGVYSDDLTKLWTESVAEDIMDNELVAISGAWGNGKTTLFTQVQKRLMKQTDDVLFVEVASLDVPRVRIGHIMTAVLMNDGIRSTSEPIRRDLEARSLQVIRLLGEAVYEHKKHVVIFIEDGHELHERTILAIKNMREKRYGGKTKFFSVVLIGQPGLMAKINAYGEVRCRTQRYELHESAGWMTFDRRVDFLRQVYGDALEHAARKRIASVRPTMLGMEDLVYSTMLRCYKAGIRKLTADLFEASLIERYEMLKAGEDGVSLDKVASAAGLSKSTVHGLMHGSIRNRDKMAAVKKALDQLENARHTEPAGKMAAAGR